MPRRTPVIPIDNADRDIRPAWRVKLGTAILEDALRSLRHATAIVRGTIVASEFIVERQRQLIVETMAWVEAGDVDGEMRGQGWFSFDGVCEMANASPRFWRKKFSVYQEQLQQETRTTVHDAIQWAIDRKPAAKKAG